MNGLALVQKSEAVRFDLFLPLIQGQELEQTLELDPEHFPQRIVAGDVRWINGVAENVVIVFFHTPTLAYLPEAFNPRGQNIG